jgi:hypothetical protein
MAEITKVHVEWAVVGRLRLLLEETPHKKFNVTQSYALFTSILCWVLQHIRTPDKEDDAKIPILGATLDPSKKLLHNDYGFQRIFFIAVGERGSRL